MSDAQISDLKEFITITISSELKSGLADFEKKFEQKFDQKLELLCKDMNDGFAAVTDAISSIHDNLDNHEQRLTKLEQRTA